MNTHCDYFGVEATSLINKNLFLFDMDGTIYTDDILFDGTLQLLHYIKNIGGKYVFVTNNSSKSVGDYVNKINKLGIEADEDNFFTSTQATALYIKTQYPGANVYCQGTESFIRELRKNGINITDGISGDVDVVLVGFDTELTSGKIRKTCELLQRDIPYIATNPDLACPVSFGFIPDCGSICMMLENATGRKPIYIGKPKATMIDAVLTKFNTTKAQAVIIGDRLYTDIASGQNAGIASICVLTGEADVKAILSGNVKPTYTFCSVKEIYECLNSITA